MSALRDSLRVSKRLGKLTTKSIANVKEAIAVSQAAVANEARGNHPYTDRTQNLTNAIAPGKITVGLNFMSGEVVAQKEYAEFVEQGTSRSRPFPYLGPALLREIPRFRQRVANAVKL